MTCKYCYHDHSVPDMDDLEAACDCCCRETFIDTDEDLEIEGFD